MPSICGPDRRPHAPEMRRAVLDILFPQKGSSSYCCLYHITVQTGPTGRSYVIQALGDPWPYPLGCQGCDLPGSRRPSIASERYRAVLTLDGAGRPLSLSSTVTLLPTPPHGPTPTPPARTVTAQQVVFAYSGTWTVQLPDGSRIACPRWDRTPGSWCVHAR